MENVDFSLILNEYGLIVVFIGLASSLLCGILKIPIAKKIRSLDITEKQKSDRIRNICTIIVAVLSVSGVCLYRCLTVHSFAPFATKELYAEILSAIAFSKIAYMLYEGVGPVSIKKWLHALWNKIFSKTGSVSTSDQDAITGIVETVQSILSDMHLPMTESQKSFLDGKLRENENGTTAYTGTADQNKQSS